MKVRKGKLYQQKIYKSLRGSGSLNHTLRTADTTFLVTTVSKKIVNDIYY